MSRSVFCVKLFAQAREAVGSHQVQVVVDNRPSAQLTVGELKQLLLEQHPALKVLSSQLMFSVNKEFATEEQPVRPEDELACFPPVGGG